ncbi:methylated-DNA--protein-cysteine methyltransferase isoform X3 [Acanthochromis polyacanthus]|uniref:methylated-DNA--protein-cysteine methyltransferase isoform X3 n=1 Tax=Acanthochromis polyacanthus TaxID=80966 RepID=UPI000B8F015F|nr:methylated-DNA--protein-cysteine methyltransferase isoform X3 [Acanthochromis polyacanthus]
MQRALFASCRANLLWFTSSKKAYSLKNYRIRKPPSCTLWGSKMKKQRESQCTQKTISLLSPLGTIQVSGCENGVHTIQILMDVAPAERSSEAPLSCVVNDSPAETSPELQRCVEWLQAYFSEPQTAGSLPLPAFHHPALQGDAFSSRVLQVLQRDVKFGETVSYKRLAEMAGNPKAARAVGGAMRKNPRACGCFVSPKGRWQASEGGETPSMKTQNACVGKSDSEANAKRKLLPYRTAHC